MSLNDFYAFSSAGQSDDNFEFISVGPNGQFTILVQIGETRPMPDSSLLFYNVGFAVKLVDPDGISYADDTFVIGNNDTDKILQTVSKIAFEYSEKYPERILIFYGSTRSRDVLYRRNISKNLLAISEYFLVMGIKKDGSIVEYQPNTDYRSILLKRK